MPHLGVKDRTAWPLKQSVTQAMIDREEVRLLGYCND